MGFPSQGAEGLYRNPMTEVQRFLSSKFPDSYKVYNLCSEREYDSKWYVLALRAVSVLTIVLSFDGRCARFPFDDHNPCSFNMILKFCRDVHRFLLAKPDNVVAIQ